MRPFAILISVAFVFVLSFGLMIGAAEAKRVCKGNHYHFGDSSPKPTKKLAEKDAIANWAAFTALEYGAEWASFRRALKRKTTCTKAGSQWTCYAEGIPCYRRARRSRRSS